MELLILVSIFSTHTLQLRNIAEICKRNINDTNVQILVPLHVKLKCLSNKCCLDKQIIHNYILLKIIF
jgi:hypothetical protein